jgi:hypothetical protein
MAFYQFYFFAISAAEIPIRTRLSTVPFRLEATQKKILNVCHAEARTSARNLPFPF